MWRSGTASEESVLTIAAALGSSVRRKSVLEEDELVGWSQHASNPSNRLHYTRNCAQSEGE